MSDYMDLDYQAWAEEECVRRLREYLDKIRQRKRTGEAVAILEDAEVGVPQLTLVPPVLAPRQIDLDIPAPIDRSITLPTSARVVRLHEANIELPG